MIASALAASSLVGNVHITSPRRQKVDSDGRSGRTRRLNGEFEMIPVDSLPPSTGSFRNINVERMERGYECIASSTSDLARHKFVRGVNVINNDIISSI